MHPHATLFSEVASSGLARWQAFSAKSDQAVTMQWDSDWNFWVRERPAMRRIAQVAVTETAGEIYKLHGSARVAGAIGAAPCLPLKAAHRRGVHRHSHCLHRATHHPHRVRAPSSCPVFCPSSSIPFPENTTIIAGDVYSHPSSPSSSPYPSHFAAVFDCPEGVHTLAGALQSPLQARKRVHSNMCILIFMCASLRPR